MSFKKIYKLRNAIQEYAWGSHEAISALLGQKTPSEKPQAELWMGAHPKASSQIRMDGRWVLLSEIIEKHPAAILGKTVAERFHGKLPYLFKVLAAAKPLSIQAHPDLNQARAGYQRENELNIPLDASRRNYRDDRHKPECICALTSFWALNGFRKRSDILLYFNHFSKGILASELNGLRRGSPSEGLKRFFMALMALNVDQKTALIQNALSHSEKKAKDDPVFRWMVTLNREYPNDIGVLSPIFLNLIRLEPGQAMFLPAGNLHAYLEGTGIELMANSDNVLRGGLTPKHIDMAELLRILDFSEKKIRVLKPVHEANGEYRFSTQADEFYLSKLIIDKDRSFHSRMVRSVEILLCTEGRATLINLDLNERMAMEKGSSAIIPASVNGYAVEGEAEIFKAATPIEE